MVVIHFELLGDKIVERELLRIAKAPDMRRIAPSLRDYLQSVERSQFDSEGRTGSGGWARLKPRTMASKAARGHDPRILRASERLRKSLTNKTSGDAIFEFDADSMRFGTRVPYARYHQTGTRRMPARKPVELSERNRRHVVKQIQREILGRS